jgi:uncharacterized protein (DUF934 family)
MLNDYVTTTSALLSWDQSTLKPLAHAASSEVTVTLNEWLAPDRAQVNGSVVVGLLVAPDDDVLKLVDQLDGISFIAIEFPKFTDGRGLSSAYLLRTRLGWNGPLRAVGEILVDQLQPLARCGFDQFLLAPNQSIETAQRTITAFSNAYQGTANQAQPLFRRRAVTIADVVAQAA